MIWLAVAVAGAAGATCRHIVDHAVTSRSAGRYPWGILLVNLTGALLIGVVAGAVARGAAPSATATIAGVGFCGAYTTFSTLAYDTWYLLEQRAYGAVLAQLASLPLGMAAAALGWALSAA